MSLTGRLRGGFAQTVRQRLGFGLLDQGTSAALSFVVVLGSARVLTPSDFGAFALLNGAFVLLFTIEQALVSEASVIAHSGTSVNRRAVLVRSARQGLTVNAGLSVAGGVTAYLLVGDPAIAVAFTLTCSLGLSADTVRGLLITSGRAAEAGVLGAGSLGLALVVFGLLPAQQTTLLTAVAAWSVVFLPTVVYAVVFAIAKPGLLGRQTGIAHDAVRRRIQGTLLLEAAVGGSAQFVALLAVDALVSREEAGALRLAIALVGPVSVLFNVVRLYGVAELRRSPTAGGMRMAVLIGVCCALIALLAWLALVLVPESLLVWLLGPSWAGTEELIGWAALHRAAAGLALGVGVVLRAQHVLARPLRLRMVTSPLGAAAACAGAAVAGAGGALAGLATAEALQAVGLFRILKDES